MQAYGVHKGGVCKLGDRMSLAYIRPWKSGSRVDVGTFPKGGRGGTE